MSESTMDLNNMLTSNRVPKVTVTKLDDSDELMDDNEFTFLNMHGGAKGDKKPDDKNTRTSGNEEEKSVHSKQESTPDVGAKRSIFRADNFVFSDKATGDTTKGSENNNNEGSRSISFEPAVSARQIAEELKVKPSSSYKSKLPDDENENESQSNSELDISSGTNKSKSTSSNERSGSNGNENASVSNGNENASVSNSNENASVSNGNENGSGSNGNENASGNSNENASGSNGNETSNENASEPDENNSSKSTSSNEETVETNGTENGNNNSSSGKSKKGTTKKSSKKTKKKGQNHNNNGNNNGNNRSNGNNNNNNAGTNAVSVGNATNVSVTLQQPEVEYINVNAKVSKADVNFKSMRKALEKRVGELEDMKPEELQELKVKLSSQVTKGLELNTAMLEGLVKAIDNFGLKMVALEDLIKNEKIKLTF
jgi:hypothetical protein